ncbi:MAG: helix-turn-helix transcriptional regulator [Spirosomataceae bacterium]
MPLLIVPTADTSSITAEIEEGVQITVTNNARTTLPELKEGDMLLLIEVHRLTRLTLLKYRYIADASSFTPGVASLSAIQIQIVMESRWNKYQLFKKETEATVRADKVFESYALSSVHCTEEFIQYISTYYNRSKIRLLSLFYELLATLNEDATASTKIPADEKEKLEKVKKKVIENFTSRPPTLEILAAEIGMSKSKMKQLFKDFYGESIYQFHQKAKLNYAADLLKTQRYTVSQVAYKVGYNHSIKFIKIFEKYFDTTPGKFKQQYE